MSIEWAIRERDTNSLIRAIAGYLFSGDSVTPGQLYGLCRLTWLTANFDGKEASYIKSTKLPALADIFNRDFADIGQAARSINAITKQQGIDELILRHTGFTNFYNAYRNSARQWFQDQFAALYPVLKGAYALKNDADGRALYEALGNFPAIARPNDMKGPMPAQNLLTPLLFSLDPRLRCPLINGNQGTNRLLSTMNAQKATVGEQYDILTGLYGNGGLVDAADLDQVGGDLPDFVNLNGRLAAKNLLEIKPTEGNELSLKDDADIVSLQDARTLTSRRLHNQITNDLRDILKGYTLLEGTNKDAVYDILVQDFDRKGSDLLIEVKTSLERSHIRMAIGQVLDYQFMIKPTRTTNLAILLPQEPEETALRLLKSLDIGLLWMNGGILQTRDEWLRFIASKPLH